MCIDLWPQDQLIYLKLLEAACHKPSVSMGLVVQAICRCTMRHVTHMGRTMQSHVCSQGHVRFSFFEFDHHGLPQFVIAHSSYQRAAHTKEHRALASMQQTGIRRAWQPFPEWVRAHPSSGSMQGHPYKSSGYVITIQSYMGPPMEISSSIRNSAQNTIITSQSGPVSISF